MLLLMLVEDQEPVGIDGKVPSVFDRVRFGAHELVGNAPATHGVPEEMLVRKKLLATMNRGVDRSCEDPRW